MHAFEATLGSNTLGVPSMGAYEGNYDYHVAGDFSRDYRQIDQALSVPEFAKVAAPFIRSIDRIIFLSSFRFSLFIGRPLSSGWG
jgi:hypothetical protein